MASDHKEENSKEGPKGKKSKKIMKGLARDRIGDLSQIVFRVSPKRESYH
jgi:hypothetical protein